jgi:hypothetical protein
MIATIGAIVFAFLASVLYLCTIGTMASEPVRTEAQLAGVLVFVLTLWLRLEGA